MLLGPSGTGKTHLAIAYGMPCWRGKTRFISAADLVIELEAAKAKAA